MKISEALKLNEEGYTLLQKLILHRIEIDIQCEKNELESLEDKLQEILRRSGFFNKINELHKEQAIMDTKARIEKKETWRTKWESQNISNLSPNLINLTFQDLIDRHSDTVKGRVQLFLILQEVIHTPIYNSHKSFAAAGKEKNFEIAISEISFLCGLNNIGQTIIDDTKKFFKDVKRENSNILKLGIYGLVGASALAAIFLMPVIAPAIGGLFGLSGAAATASGLAFLGGGSIVAGGFGMAGGMTVLVGGSGVLGAIAGGAAGKLLSQLPQEAIAQNVIKIVNLINFLKSGNNPDRELTDTILSDTISLFLEFKHAAENEVAFNNVNKEKKKTLQLLDILNTGLKKII